MTWKQETTSRRVTVDADVHVELDEFGERQLLQALIDAEWISEREAEAIAQRAAQKEKAKQVVEPPRFDEGELQVALDYMRARRMPEALIHLERALGRDWIGQLTN